MHAIRSQDRSYLWLMTELLLLISFFLVCMAVTGKGPLCDNSSYTCIICTLFRKCYTSIRKLTKNIPVDLGATLMLLTTELPASFCSATVGVLCQRAQRKATASQQGHLFPHEAFQDYPLIPTQMPPPPPLNLQSFSHRCNSYSWHPQVACKTVSFQDTGAKTNSGIKV